MRLPGSALGAIAGLLTVVSGSAQSARRPIELEDFYRFETVSSPAMSPDGRQVAFVRTVVEEADNRRRSEVWLAPSAGTSAPTRLTGTAGSATDPRWSPDGRLLAFRRRQSGAASDGIWIIDLGRPGEPYQIDGLEALPRFSPDGQWIAFIKAVRPATQVEAPLSEVERKIRDRFTGRAHETVQYRFDGRGYLPDQRDPDVTPPEELFVLPAGGGTPKRLTTIGTTVEDAAWSPDSKRLAIAANSHARDEYSYERADLWIVDLDGGITRLTDDGYHHDQVAWSPDGSALVFRRQKGLNQVIAAKDSAGAPIDLFIMNAAGGEARNLTERWDLIPENPVFSPDGRQVLFGAEARGNHHLFRVDISTGAVAQVTTGDRQLEGFSFSSDGTRMAYVATDPTHPTEAFADGGPRPVQLSHFNDSLLAAVSLATPERLSYASRDGTPIEGWLLRPAATATGTRTPLVVSIHGGPHGQFGTEFSIPFQLLAAQGYSVLYTNPRGSTGYGERFLWATWGAWGKLDGEDVLAGVDYVTSHYPIDAKRIGVSGYSYGGFLTNWLITHDHRFAAAIAGAGISNWVSDYGTADIPRTKESEFFGPPWEPRGRDHLLAQSPILFAKGVTTPTLFIQGEADYRVPVEQGEQMYTALRKQRVAARMVRYPGMSHGGWTPWNTVHRYHEELGWWRRFLDQKPTP